MALIIWRNKAQATDIYFIPNKTFIDVICKLYENEENCFEEVWYRWENNNLRFCLSKLFVYIDKFKLSYWKLYLNLASFKKQDSISSFNKTLNQIIENELEKLIY